MRRSLLAAALALGLTLAAGGAAAPTAGMLVFATGGDGVSGRLELAAMRPDGTGFRKLTHQIPAISGAPRWTTGAAVVFASPGGAAWRVRSDGSGLRRLAAREFDVVSPSGRFSARFTRRGEVEILGARGRRLRTVALRLGRDETSDWELLWSPDERRIAASVIVGDEEFSYVVVARVDGADGGVRRITPRRRGHQEWALSWSPDGRRLLVDVWEKGHLDRAAAHALSSDGRIRRRLYATGAYNAARDWSPDSSRVAFAGRRGGIFVVSARTGRTRQLATTASRGQGVATIGLSWSRTGLIAYTDAGGVYTIRPDGSGRRLLTRRRSYDPPAWSPDGTRLLFVDDTGAIVVARPNGSVRTLLPAARWDDSARWSPDGARIAFIRGPVGLEVPERIGVFVMRSDGNRVRRVGTGYGPRWSPDGGRLAYVAPLAAERRYQTRGAGRIVVVNRDGTGARVIGVGTAPAWAPNGRELTFMRYAFATEDKGTEDEHWVVARSTLYRVRADGSDLRPVLSTSWYDGEPIHATPAWAPDGSAIALVSVQAWWDDAGDAHSTWTVSLVDARSGVVRTLAKREVSELAWSPDGRRLAYASWGQLGVLTTDGVAVRLATGPGEMRSPAWSPDGRRIGYVGCDRKSCDVYTVGAAGGRTTRLTRTPGMEGGLDWSRR